MRGHYVGKIAALYTAAFLCMSFVVLEQKDNAQNSNLLKNSDTENGQPGTKLYDDEYLFLVTFSSTYTSLISKDTEVKFISGSPLIHLYDNCKEVEDFFDPYSQIFNNFIYLEDAISSSATPTIWDKHKAII